MSIWLPILVLLSIILVVISTVRWRLHPLLALIFASYLFGLLSGTKFPGIVKITFVTSHDSLGFSSPIAKALIVVQLVPDQ